MKVTAIFDIGKTNKKFFLFDEALEPVFQISAEFPQVPDDDGFPGEDLPALENWMRQIFLEARARPGISIHALNFATYGASFVHLDEAGLPIAPLYNYLKPFPEALAEKFYRQYGPMKDFSLQTASPPLGMLNSGLQLYWLRHQHPATFSKIRTSLHLPQYCSYLFTRRPATEFTSLGCHTALWDFGEADYHPWVMQEGLRDLFPPIVSATGAPLTEFMGQELRIGTGIHDSSAALLPYLYAAQEPFLLLSTGTWSICLNPFCQEPLSPTELKADCLNYLRPDGKTVRASRLFLGQALSEWTARIEAWFQMAEGSLLSSGFNPRAYRIANDHPENRFRFDSIPQERNAPAVTDLTVFQRPLEAYHRLMIELVELQVRAISLARGRTSINRIFVDGGFAGNEIFLRLLSGHFPAMKILTTDSPHGTALGAALAVLPPKPDSSRLNFWR